MNMVLVALLLMWLYSRGKKPNRVPSRKSISSTQEKEFTMNELTILQKNHNLVASVANLKEM